MAHEARFDDGVTVSDDRERIDLDRAFGWISRESYWAAGIPAEVFARAVGNSIAAGIYAPSGEMVGFARVVSDRATYAWLCDVWIEAGSRGGGLAQRLVAYFLDHPDLQGLRRWALATRDAHGLYARFGFTAVDAGRAMERLDREVYRRGRT